MVYFVDSVSKLLFSIAIKILSWLHIDVSEQHSESLMQFIRFGLVGLSNTVIGYLLYIIFLFLFRAVGLPESVDYIISNVLSWILSVFWSFIWNKRCVFRMEETDSSAFFKALFKAYCSYALTGLVLNNILLYVFVSQLGISKALGPCLVLLISIPVNFLLNKFWTFRKKQGQL